MSELIFEVPLDAVNLIEASAGTGKTYAIAGLYLRLLLERGYRVGDILVVTFTEAATEELKDRIQQRLLEVRRAFQHEDDRDPLCRQLLERCPERPPALRRLNNALLAFDEAAIFTIHGFCQRVLTDSAFASGAAFETEVIADQRALLQEIVEDFWRRRLHDASPQWVRYLIQQGLRPADLQQRITAHLGKPYLQIAALEDLEALPGLEQRFATAFTAARQLWWDQRGEITGLLLNAVGLHGGTYKKASMPDWFADLDEYLRPEPAPSPKPPEKLVNFTARKLQDRTIKKHTPPQHDFFSACDELHQAAEALKQACDYQLQRLYYELLCYCNEQLPARKRSRQLQSYDDMLLNLHQALHDGRQGPQLAAQVRARFSAALIDEFQDTDPIQYAIFHTIYQDSGQPVFLVGDPKQAIYSFRGADVFTYLRASQQASHNHTLSTNWRSAPDLVTAVNTLFAQRRDPFLLGQIPFQTVRPAAHEQPRLVADDGADAPLRFWFVNAPADEKRWNKAEATAQIAHATAGQIATLLKLGQQGSAYIAERDQPRSLHGGDIAVLVRDRFQAQHLRRALLAVGVPCVQQSRDSVLHSNEAADLERVLRAIADPPQEPLVRAALLTDLFGLTAAELYALGQQDRDWEALLMEFTDYHERWRDQGFMPMLRHLLMRRDGYRRLLAYQDGERRLTNLLHLAELLQQASLQQRLGLAGLVKWLAEQRQAPADDDEFRQLRLESDAQLVKIVTVHKSKGLEYPIVFCPFLWEPRLSAERKETTILQFHDPDADYQAVLDMGSPRLEEQRPLAVREQLAEELRLTYVALTRAKFRCYVVWGAISQAEKSALAWLLHPPPVVGPGDDPLTVNRQRVAVMTDAVMLGELRRLAQRAGGAIHVAPLPTLTVAPYRPDDGAAPTLTARHFSGRIRSGWRFTSFSALQERRDDSGSDYDPALPAVEPVSDERNTFTFPQGARAGRCLHAIFEMLDFTAAEQWPTVVTEKLARYGFAADWAEVVTAWVARVLHTPLDADGRVTLAGVKRAQRLTELEFLYPFEALDATVVKDLVQHHWPGLGAALERLDFRWLAGFMRGFIDLVFASGGRFYLVDYKSNWLGGQPADYQGEALTTAMIAGGYPLQYLIYTLALHRYLRQRLPGYDYARDFAGVRYLFLRGMDPVLGAASGVFADRPPPPLIAALDQYLAQGSR